MLQFTKMMINSIEAEWWIHDFPVCCFPKINLSGGAGLVLIGTHWRNWSNSFATRLDPWNSSTVDTYPPSAICGKSQHKYFYAGVFLSNVFIRKWLWLTLISFVSIHDCLSLVHNLWHNTGSLTWYWLDIHDMALFLDAIFGPNQKSAASFSLFQPGAGKNAACNDYAHLSTHQNLPLQLRFDINRHFRSSLSQHKANLLKVLQV